MSRLLLATTEPSWEARVRESFDNALNGELKSWGDASLAEGDSAPMLAAINAHDARVVALGPGLDADPALEFAAMIDRERPDLCVLLVAEPTPELYRKALRAGVRDIVDPSSELSDVRAAFDAAIDAAGRRHAQGVTELATETRRTIAVVSPKGGAGKTAIASNLSVGLAGVAPHEVVIVDLDVQFGDVGNALRLSPEATICDAVLMGEALDGTSLKAFLTAHPSGAYVLCAPDSPAEADLVTGDDIARVLRLLTHEFRFVIIDTGAGLDEHTLAALEHATDLILVCGTDVASARAMRKEIEAFDLLGITTQRRHLVLNRADARVGLTAEDIEGTVGLDVSISVPSSRSVPLSMNQGIPLLEGAQKSPVSRSLGELVNRLAGDPPTHPDSSTAGRLRRRKESR
jgi:pilus assembly protein CpaE